MGENANSNRGGNVNSLEFKHKQTMRNTTDFDYGFQRYDKSIEINAQMSIRNKEADEFTQAIRTAQ